MFSAFFGFFNRIGRLQFWLVALATGIIIMVPVMMMGARIAGEAGTLAAADATGEKMEPGVATAIVADAVSQYGVLLVIAAFVCLWMYLSSYIQRLHDLNHSGWWILAAILVPIAVQIIVSPVVGMVLTLAILAYLGFWPGTSGPNRFGNGPVGVAPDPGASKTPKGSYAAISRAGDDVFVRTPRAKHRPV